MPSTWRIDPSGLALALVWRAFVSCGFPSRGDATRTVTVENRLGETIDLYTFQRDDRYRTRLKPNDALSEGWMFPISSDDHRVRRIEADDLQGRRVFCLDLTYELLAARGWRIELTPGRENC